MATATSPPAASPLRASARFVKQQLKTYAEPITMRRRTQAYERDRLARKQQYAAVPVDTERYASTLEDLRRDGFAKIPQVLDHETLSKLAAELEAHLDSGEKLNPISRDAARQEGDLQAAKDKLTGDEVRQGQQYFRELTNYASVNEPLLNCVSVKDLAFLDILIDIAAGYLDCFPALGGFNLRKSFANGIPVFDTQFFHFDQNSPKLLKFFMYLNDVDMDGGPFCYVKGSHTDRFRGHTKKHRWTVDEIERAYGKDRIVYLTANMGDLLMADTSGCHRGTELLKNDRRMLTLNYVVHPEFEGRQKPFKIRREDFEGLNEKQKAAADFLELVD